MRKTTWGTSPFSVQRLVALLLMIMLGGCLSAPPERESILRQALPITTQLPPHWQGNAEASRISDKALAPVSNGWLRQFHDAHLENVVAESLLNNLDLRLAAAQVEIAAQNVTLIGSQLVPQVGLNATKKWTRDFEQSKIYRSHAVAVGTSWELDIWGRLRAEKASAQAGYQATQLDFAYARQSLVATTVKSWYAVVEAYRLLQLSEQSVRLYADLLKLVEVRAVAGKVSNFDVSQAQASLDGAQSNLQTALKHYADARRNLELLLGRYPTANIQTAKTLSDLPPVIASGAPASLISLRPDVMAAEQQVISAFRLNEADKLALLPGFSLQMDAGHFSDGLLDLLKQSPWLGHGIIGMSLPIYEGGALMANISISDEYQKQAVANYGSAVLNALNEVESGLSDEYFYERGISAADQELKQRINAVTLAKERYKAGASDMFTVLQLQTLQIETEANTIQLRYLSLSNWVNLNLALGKSFDQQPVVVASSVNAPRVSGL